MHFDDEKRSKIKIGDEIKLPNTKINAVLIC